MNLIKINTKVNTRTGEKYLSQTDLLLYFHQQHALYNEENMISEANCILQIIEQLQSF